MSAKPGADTARRWAAIIGVHLAVVLIWYLVVKLWDIPKFVIASPSATFLSLFDTYPWFQNTVITTIEIFGGYFLAVVVGVGLALIFSWPTTNAIIAFAISFLPILITTARGLREVEPDLIDLVKTLRATRWQVFVKIQLPGSLPYIFSGMKVAVVLAVAGAVVGEFIASDSGLAYLIGQVQVTLDTAAMMMSVLLITLVGVALYLIVLIMERIMVVRDARVETV
jgi:NitT/TauT family transport system permease protein